jgi:hypothetical protein
MIHIREIAALSCIRGVVEKSSHPPKTLTDVALQPNQNGRERELGKIAGKNGAS